MTDPSGPAGADPASTDITGSDGQVSATLIPPASSALPLTDLEARLATDGSVLERWPDSALAQAAQALIASDPVAHRLWQEARDLDRLLEENALPISQIREERVLARLEARLDAWQTVPGCRIPESGSPLRKRVPAAKALAAIKVAIPVWPVLSLLMVMGLAGFVSGQSAAVLSGGAFVGSGLPPAPFALATVFSPSFSTVSYLSELDQ